MMKSIDAWHICALSTHRLFSKTGTNKCVSEQGRRFPSVWNAKCKLSVPLTQP